MLRTLPGTGARSPGARRARPPRQAPIGAVQRRRDKEADVAHAADRLLNSDPSAWERTTAGTPHLRCGHPATGRTSR
ncbi:hypothetical protein [Streptomyces sp. NPDC058291]|uniref:hypothetical protein n=1 Tax=Streptomyces sp. NPDC058291 TaxID=3346427 RepID=UPI0036E860B7